jgi:hypothetical protein
MGRILRLMGYSDKSGRFGAGSWRWDGRKAEILASPPGLALFYVAKRRISALSAARWERRGLTIGGDRGISGGKGEKRDRRGDAGVVSGCGAIIACVAGGCEERRCSRVTRLRRLPRREGRRDGRNDKPLACRRRAPWRATRLLCPDADGRRAMPEDQRLVRCESGPCGWGVRVRYRRYRGLILGVAALRPDFARVGSGP